MDREFEFRRRREVYELLLGLSNMAGTADVLVWVGNRNRGPEDTQHAELGLSR